MAFTLFSKKVIPRNENWELPGGPVVGTPSFPCRGHDFIPGQGTKILHNSKPRKKKKKERKKENEGFPVLFLRLSLERARETTEPQIG